LSRARNGIDAEELLGSRGRVRVLKVLAESGELNISEVGRRTGMNYTSVERHLKSLKEMGLLREKRYGKIRIFEVMFRTVSIRFERSKGVKIEIDMPTRF